MIYDWLFGKEKKKDCGGCKLKKQETIAEFVSELNLLKAKFNDLELDYIELENINASLSSDNEELKNKNNEPGDTGSPVIVIDVVVVVVVVV